MEKTKNSLSIYFAETDGLYSILKNKFHPVWDDIFTTVSKKVRHLLIPQFPYIVNQSIFLEIFPFIFPTGKAVIIFILVFGIGRIDFFNKSGTFQTRACRFLGKLAILIVLCVSTSSGLKIIKSGFTKNNPNKTLCYRIFPFDIYIIASSGIHEEATV